MNGEFPLARAAIEANCRFMSMHR
jgi:hypothetical protein